MSVLEDGREEGTHKRVLSPKVEMHDTVRLQESATYQFWVTASTRIGEGDSTKVVTVIPSNTVPAKIASFGREIISAWKQDVNFPCKRVGTFILMTLVLIKPKSGRISSEFLILRCPSTQSSLEAELQSCGYIRTSTIIC